MDKKDRKIDLAKLITKIKKFHDKTCDQIRDMLLDHTFFHYNTRWYNRFKKLDKEVQSQVVDKVVNIQFEYITFAMNKKQTPIVLEGLGKFIIKQGRRDFLDLIKSPEFDGDIDAAVEATKEKIKLRQQAKYEHRLNRKGKSTPVITILSWKNSENCSLTQ